MITEKDWEKLKTSLLFLNMAELRKLAAQLSLLDKGNKKVIIKRICHFSRTGEKLMMPKFPSKSCAQRGQTYPMEENGLMLKGAYKNDLNARLFFKRLIGSHFHFTAFGIDWLNERWLEGKPPTYREFAKMWEKEYQQRKRTPAAPKEEWAYINFVQTLMSISPQAGQESIKKAWQEERKKHKSKVYQLLDFFL